MAERLNRTLCDKATAMLADSRLPKRYWGEAILTANYLRNISPYAPLQGKTPYQAWTGEMPQLHYLRVFGCRVYVRANKPSLKKLDTRSQPCTFVGYQEGGRTYRVLTEAGALKVVAPSDCVFTEHHFGWATEEASSGVPRIGQDEPDIQPVSIPSTSSPSLSLPGRSLISVGGEGASQSADDDEAPPLPRAAQNLPLNPPLSAASRVGSPAPASPVEQGLLQRGERPRDEPVGAPPIVGMPRARGMPSSSDGRPPLDSGRLAERVLRPRDNTGKVIPARSREAQDSEERLAQRLRVEQPTQSPVGTSLSEALSDAFREDNSGSEAPRIA